MALLPVGQYKPDVSDYGGDSSQNILNVLAQGDGYGPFKDYTVFSGALAAACRGAFYALDDDGTVAVFAATSTRLYKMDNTTFAWTDVSASGSAYTALPSTGNWKFAQFGLYVIAVQANVAPQVFQLGTSTEFAALGGSPPQASYVDVVGRFLVLSGLTSNPYRVHWSGLNAITTWTSGTNSSDYQDFPDGGIVRGVAGGEYGYIFQDGVIRRMTYAPGSPVIFQIDRIAEDFGLYGPGSIVRLGDQVLFYSAKGFKRISPGSPIEPIGLERVDRTFFADLDKGSLQLFMGAADPRSNRAFWSYKSTDGTTGLYNKILCYDGSLDRWFPITMSGEYLLGMSQTGLTLESLDAISSSIDALTSSLDDYATSSIPEISQFNSAHKLGFFRGSNLEATLETAEQHGDKGQRFRLKGFRPITDAAGVYGSASYRDTLQASLSYTDEIAINSRTGNCDININTRLSRAKVRIPAASTWTFCAGVEPDLVQEGWQ